MMSFVCACTEFDSAFHSFRPVAIFVGLTKSRSADILSASGRSPLSFAEESPWKGCALRAGGQDIRVRVCSMPLSFSNFLGV
jgi:hypothetical protein